MKDRFWSQSLFKRTRSTTKMKYNKCAVPRLTSKLGENLYKRWEEDAREEKRKKEIL